MGGSTSKYLYIGTFYCNTLRLFQHTFGTHPKPLPTGYTGIPFIVGQGDCVGCGLGVCCNFLGNTFGPFVIVAIRIGEVSTLPNGSGLCKY